MSTQSQLATMQVAVTSNGVPIRNIWHMLLYAWKEQRFVGKWKSDIESAPTLDALLSRILADLIRQRMRIGLGRDYRPHEQTIRGIRGKVDFNRSLKQMTFPRGQVHCHFHTFSSNITKNQIIRSTLHTMALSGRFGKESKPANDLRHELRSLVRNLEHIDLIRLTPATVRRQLQERDDRDYRLMLLICEMIVRHQMPTQLTGNNQLYSVDLSWKFVWRVFEQFVANFFITHLLDWKVVPQKTLYWTTDGSSSFLPVMKPDIVMEHKATLKRVVIDTKLTGKSLIYGQHGNQTFNRDHVFQLYAYLQSQSEQSAACKTATGVLLYPVVKHTLRESVMIQGHKLRWETIDLAAPWQDIEANLFDLANSLIP